MLIEVDCALITGSDVDLDDRLAEAIRSIAGAGEQHLGESTTSIWVFHDLRHTCATLLLLQGVHPKIVSEMLGHSSVAITQVCNHALPDMQKQATEAMERFGWFHLP